MKNIFLIALLTITFSSLFVACTEEDKFNNPATHELINGGFVRFNTLPILSLNVEPGDVSGARFDNQIQDVNGNIQSLKIELTATVNGTTLDPVEYATITSLPFDFTVTAFSIADALDLTLDDLAGGDSFLFESEITLNDGRIYTSEVPVFDSETLDISGGFTESTLFQPGYRQAMSYTMTFVCPIDPAFFTGKYSVETTIDGNFGTVFDGEVTITTGAVATERIFEGDWNGFGLVREWIFDLICDQIVFKDQQSTGLACPGNPNILLGTATNNSPYSESTGDEVLIVNLSEDTASCGGPDNKQIQVTFTKM